MIERREIVEMVAAVALIAAICVIEPRYAVVAAIMAACYATVCAIKYRAELWHATRRWWRGRR